LRGLGVEVPLRGFRGDVPLGTIGVYVAKATKTVVSVANSLTLFLFFLFDFFTKHKKWLKTQSYPQLYVVVLIVLRVLRVFMDAGNRVDTGIAELKVNRFVMKGEQICER